jgi:UDP-2,3-diacylglucosamine pyrophosphatase LpxH
VGQKVKFVLSDLHIGAGHPNEGNNYLEDFLADESLVAFLADIAQESEQYGHEVELIINGDLLAFLQVPPVENYDPTATYPTELYLDSSEAASIKRLNLIYQGHRAVFAALSHFMQAKSPQRRITLIKGDQDVHFFWPRLKNHFRMLLNAVGARSSLLLFAEEFVSREKIYVEHGHQHVETLNRYRDFCDPRNPQHPGQLDYPPSARLMIKFWELVRDYPFINRVKPVTILLWYALQWDVRLATKVLISLLQHAPLLAPSGTLSEGGASELLQDLQNEEICYHVLQQCTQDGNLRCQTYQQIRAYLNHFSPNDKGVPQFTAEDTPLTMAQLEQGQQGQWLYQAAQKIAFQEGSQVILFGHSHQTGQETLANGAVYINTGSWTKDFSQASPETWQALFNNAYISVKLPEQFPYARIDYDKHKYPIPQLLNFGRKAAPPLAASGSGRLPEKVIGWISRLRAS